MLEFRSVTKTYPDGTAAVADFDLVIPPHRTTVLVGSSGIEVLTLDPRCPTVAVAGRARPAELQPG